MKKKTRRRFALIVLIALLALFALLLWFFWSDLERLTKPAQKKTAPEKAAEPAQERILEQERKELEEILKRRQGK